MRRPVARTDHKAHFFWADSIHYLIPLYALSELACDGPLADALSLLLLNAPSLKRLHIENMDAANPMIWQEFRYRSIPPISVLSVHTNTGICQGFFDSVLVPLAGTLGTLRLSSVHKYSDTESQLNLTGYWRGWNNLVFPELSDLKCFRMDPVGALALTALAPNICHFFISWRFDDWELAGQLATRIRTVGKELRDLVIAVEWIYLGDANDIAGTLTRGWLDPHWVMEPRHRVLKNTMKDLTAETVTQGNYMRAFTRGYKTLYWQNR